MDPIKQFRQAVFGAALDYLESKWLTEKEVCECLKQCLDFFWDGQDEKDSKVTRDFCMVKLQRAKENGKAKG
jgi:hypothetical protein